MSRNNTLQRELLDAQRRLVEFVRAQALGDGDEDSSALVNVPDGDVVAAATQPLLRTLREREAELAKVAGERQAAELRANSAEARLEQVGLNYYV